MVDNDGFFMRKCTGIKFYWAHQVVILPFAAKMTAIWFGAKTHRTTRTPLVYGMEFTIKAENNYYLFF